MRHGWAVLFLLPAVLTPAFSADSSPRSAGSAKLSPQAAAALRRVLDVGFAAGRDKMAAARSVWQQIGAMDRQDARVEYAWGLVLQKHRSTRDALRQFQSAAGKTPAYLPAKQAAIWINLARQQHPAGLKSLREFVETVADRKLAATDAAGRLDAAEWAGRVVAALNEVPLSARTKADVEQLDALAEKAFREPTLAAAYQKGKQAVKALAGDLSVQAVKTRVLAAKKLAKKEKQSRKDIATRQGDIDKSQESLKLSAEQWKDWLDERAKQTKTGLARGAKELSVLQSRQAAISRSMLLATRQKTLLLASIQNAVRNARQAGASSIQLNQQADLALGQIEQTLLSYNNQQLATAQQMNQTRQTAAAALLQYRADVKRYEAATGRIAKSNAALDKIESNLKDQERKIGKTNVRQTAAVRRLKSQLAEFATYVPFDLDAEKKALLKSL